jgi:hypothetical protein
VLKSYGKILSTIVIFASAMLLTACPERTSIEHINRDPGRFVGKEVTIAGRVSGGFGALGTGVFQLDDGTGRMWVYSQNYGVPGKGARIAVTGRIEEGVSFGGRNFATILRETRRRH